MQIFTINYFKTVDYFYICAIKGMVSKSLFCLQCQVVNVDTKEKKINSGSGISTCTGCISTDPSKWEPLAFCIFW